MCILEYQYSKFYKYVLSLFLLSKLDLDTSAINLIKSYGNELPSNA